MPKVKPSKTKSPSGTPFERALALLAEGRWQPAHEIVQKKDSTLAAWLHGIVHMLEGDLDNARYWYKRAKRDFPSGDAIEQEIAAVRLEMGGRGAPRKR